MKESIAGLKLQLKMSQQGNSDKKSSMKLGRKLFSSINKLSAWCEDTFNGKPISFGVFADPYTVLQ